MGLPTGCEGQKGEGVWKVPVSWLPLQVVFPSAAKATGKAVVLEVCRVSTREISQCLTSSFPHAAVPEALIMSKV